MGQTFVILTTNLDLSVGGMALLANMVAASIMSGQTGFPVKAIAATLSLGIALGLGHGILVTRLRIPSLKMTLATWQIFKGGAWTMTGGWPITDLPEELDVFTRGMVGPIPVATIVFIVVVVVSHFVLGYTTFGRSVYALGGNRVSAWLSGVNVKNTVLFVFMISGFCAVLASIISLSRTMAGTLTAGEGLELDSITAAAIGGISLAGGKGTIIGAVLGVFIIAVINNGMNRLGILPAWQLIVRAVAIIVAVAVDYIRRRG
jgi:ribose/xylose/arabinose/galactoside ABC-type transport system permease subunit